MPHLEVQIIRLPGFRHGATDGRVIYLDSRLTERELRCALTHELVHLEMRHRGCQPAAVEKQVRQIVAELLIPESQLMAVAQWTSCAIEAAEELNVTDYVLEDRLMSEGLTLGYTGSDWDHA